jgi:DNA polymerase/3'-5' exonuclease PolX
VPEPLNAQVAARIDEVAGILEDKGANLYRVRAYRRAADTLRRLDQPVGELLAERGLPGLEELPGIGESLARSIRELVDGKVAHARPIMRRRRPGGAPRHRS